MRATGKVFLTVFLILAFVSACGRNEPNKDPFNNTDNNEASETVTYAFESYLYSDINKRADKERVFVIDNQKEWEEYLAKHDVVKDHPSRDQKWFSDHLIIVYEYNQDDTAYHLEVSRIIGGSEAIVYLK